MSENDLLNTNEIKFVFNLSRNELVLIRNKNKYIRQNFLGKGKEEIILNAGLLLEINNIQ